MRRAQRMRRRIAVITDGVDPAPGQPPRSRCPHCAATDHRHPHRLLGRDARYGLAWNDGIADLEEEIFDDAGDGGRDLRVDLVGVDLHQRLALGHVLAALLAPRADGDLFRPLQLGHDNFGNFTTHAVIVGRSSCPSHVRPADEDRPESLGRDDVKLIACLYDLPFPFMHQPVMEMAERRTRLSRSPGPPRAQNSMWCGVNQLTGRSQPGQRQPRSRCWSARRVPGGTVRVARPTSTTTESAISTRDIVPSQASRSTVVPEIGIPSSSSAAGAPSSRFKPGSVVVRLTWGRTPLRRGSKPSFMWSSSSSARASAMRWLGLRVSAGPRQPARASSAVRKAAPVTGSSTPSTECMPSRMGLTWSQRRSKSSLESVSKPSGSATCRAWRQQMWKSSIEKVWAKPTISASLAGCHRSPSCSRRWQSAEAAWQLIAPPARAAAV